MKLMIYGAQGIALSTYRALERLYSQRPVECFIVSNLENNPKSLAGKAVVELSALAQDLNEDAKNEVEILIATPETVMAEIEEGLIQAGFTHTVRMDSKRFSDLQAFYYAKDGEIQVLSTLPVGSQMSSLHVCMSKFYRDKQLQSEYTYSDWIIPVQAGAALTDVRVADILDSDGENISAKNGNYSELTVLYWMYRNQLCGHASEDEYFGLAHYRRLLVLSEDDILRLRSNDVDVVLPYPMLYEPSISEHPKRYLKQVDWNALVKAMEEIHPEQMEVFWKILEEPYMYNYNISIGKKSVIREYCDWLFPILERVEELSEPKDWDRKDRYIGYMGELLTTVYFRMNRDRLNIVHTGYRFLT